ncbi:SPOR domain-containing protein [Saccharicrinis fermentans]|uniref:Sporulation related domain protein n=1 Tax=Saccharicrinis fermentans DSM 9555 = JCM 21142 TaxID=869213 RepID=W7YDV2_9BACT|nr:SPOR domain-containing protein [Saccharicrinis fermentans]GAF05648.1 sporulation related domain protein [Saccharicrinis fermentans DSM 9555 = JCM 21142]
MYKLFLLTTLTLSVISCRSLKDSGSSSFSDSDSPYVQEEPVVKPKVKPKPIVVKEEKFKVIESEDDIAYKYYVIIGSFKVLNNARTYKNTLIEEGFTPVILENENGLYRVSVSAYKNETDARNKVGYIRTEFEKYNDTWLLIRKR